MIVVAGLLLLFLSGLGLRLILTGGHVRSAGETAENRSHTRTSEEEMVKRFILNNTEGVADITFLTWGPHMLPDEVEQLRKDADSPLGSRSIVPTWGLADPDKIPAVLRVKYRVRIRAGASERVVRDGPVLRGDWKPGEEHICDELFVVAGGLILPGLGSWSNIGENVTASDDWKKAYRKELATTFPGIKP
jgi:hypothetical protein